jgi:hypothetical protein
MAMGTTEDPTLVVDTTAPVEPDHDEPDQIVDLSLPFVQFRIEEDEGDLVIVASDGETEAIFGPGLGGIDSQINGAERAAEMFARYVDLLRVRRGDPQPLETPVLVQPPVNAPGW